MSSICIYILYPYILTSNIFSPYKQPFCPVAGRTTAFAFRCFASPLLKLHSSGRLSVALSRLDARRLLRDESQIDYD